MTGTEQAADWAQVWQQLQILFWNLAGSLGSRLSPLNILSMLALCLAIYLIRKPAAGFFAWLFPARVYRNASFWLDVKLLVFNGAIGLFITLNYTVVATVAAGAIGAALGITAPSAEHRNPLLSALIVFLAADLAIYWYHRIHHASTSLWAIHALHHSAEEMSPLTAFRHHPLYSIIGGLILAVCIGVAQGLTVIFLTGSLDLATLAGTNLFSALLNLFTANLRHSHIWLRYPAALEHLLISPAQHQVHHSIDPRHYNKNYGEVLALWDWAFGTLYITKPNETIRFGLGDENGVPAAQRHSTFWQALSEPVSRALQALNLRSRL